MRIALVSDIHGNLPALEAVWAEIRAAAPDVVVNLGDIASGPLWPRETVQWLVQRERDAAPPWVMVRGNHERQVLAADVGAMGASDAFAARALGAAERAWLAALPPTRWLAPDVFLCHGTPASDVQYFLETTEPGWRRGGFPGVRAATPAEARQRADGPPPGDPGARRALQASLVACGHTHMPRLLALAEGPLVVNPGSVGLPAFDDAHGHPHVIESGTPHARWALVERTGGSPSR